MLHIQTGQLGMGLSVAVSRTSPMSDYFLQFQNLDTKIIEHGRVPHGETY